MEINLTFLLAIILVLLLHYQMAMSLTTNIITDKIALLTFKSHLQLSPSDILFTNWSANSASVCDWVGVTCSSRPQRVTALDLSTMGLTGTLVPHLGNLTFLVSLKLSINNLHGVVPPELVQLQQLKDVDFSFNSLSGEIPSWFGFLPQLQYLRLSNNSFSGPIPPSLSFASQLQVLQLSCNPLQGQIPQEIGSLHNLKSLGLQYNRLNGSVPLTLFNLSKMEFLRLTGNALSGNIPDDICRNLPRLVWLGLSKNQYLYGQIPSNISQCSRLQGLSLAFNMFDGPIPREIGQLRMIGGLYLSGNNFTGAIPEELGNLTTLEVLDMGSNKLEGSIPPQVFNISSLRYVNMYHNNISGMLPEGMCTHLKQLQTLQLKDNGITGSIPTRLYQCSALRVLNLASNKMHGPIPPDIGNITLLEELDLAGSNLTGEIPCEINHLTNLREIELSWNNLNGSFPQCLSNISTLLEITISGNQLTGNLARDFGYGLPNLEVLRFDGNYFTSDPWQLRSFITSLANCRNLKKLAMSQNPLTGTLPGSVGNLSSSLENFHMADCKLVGSIPEGIGNLSNLIVLDLFGNRLTGTFPKSLVNMKSLQGLHVSGNRMSGPIPTSVCKLPKLFALGMGNNRISGAVPECIGNIPTLGKLYLDSNRLSGNIPASLWSLTNLLVLNLSRNSFVGPLSPDMANLKAAAEIHLSMNMFSGVIPSRIGELGNLGVLKMARNRLRGSIPESIGNMTNLNTIDLSHNDLTGTIPKSLRKLQLMYFNVSFNSLYGEIPFNATFENITFESFLSNKGFCGDPQYHVPLCKVEKQNKKLGVLLISSGTFSSVILVVILAYVGITKCFGRETKTPVIPELTRSLLGGTRFRVSYYEILEATQRCNRSNLLGSGSFGSVYRGTLRNGVDVAVKVFNLQLENAFKSFEVECEVLRSLHHRNLCKVVGCCSNKDFKALVLEYMPFGSLEQWLYSHDHFLEAIMRIRIMIDVACALEYLHEGYSSPVIHCDLKPSNILLDGDMNAHLCDFGVAKLLGDGESVVQTMTLATLSYIAPEYGTGGFVSVKCDVYSYGIVLLEVFTRKRPTDEIFVGDMSLRSWVKSSMPNALSDVIDPNLLMRPAGEDHGSNQTLDCLSSVMELGLKCSVESPRERMKIKDVIAALNKIKLKLLAI
ncbi:LRR receptor-like serine/threonine-protein kinase gso1 [Phtheirospermum japonicum]|uniref:non-specific serine/threonine protein kinase n=1 Tax=Phtheirospermum japonicum TaxID=374723 RepID=A0A830D8I6_9LAMI|nr:LRR receptor-like serine/threonine-protein kinase gso1 [Phtheirospermum japonicum]